MDTNTYAELAYETYCREVGGKAFNGDPLPDWTTFYADPNKSKQANGWIAASAAVTERVAAQIFNSRFGTSVEGHQLLPCPCCGGRAEETTNDYIDDHVLIYCTVCEMMVTKPESDEAIAAWNRRPNQ